MSGTTPQGNWLYKVADSIRKDGLVLESDWPFPPPFVSWDEYYSEIPPEIVSKGPDFLKWYDITYEWIAIDKDSLLYHIKHAPLQIVVNGGLHAVVDFFCEGDIHRYFDSYDPFRKSTTAIISAMKIVVTPKPMLRLVILGKEQYIVGKDGLAYHIYNAATLPTLLSAGIISSLTPEPVTAIQDSGKDFVLLTQE